MRLLPLQRPLPLFALLLAALLLSACGVLMVDQWDRLYGHGDPHRFDQPAPPRAGQVSYRQVEPVLSARCAVCHGCYDAPCQLKMTAWEGLARGASTDKVYDGTRLRAVAPTRLFEDAFSASAWRERGFHPVLNERPGIEALDGSLIAQMLLLKQQHPLPAGCKVLPDSFNVSIDRPQQCTTIENFADYARQYPLWGMPFGLPELDAAERELLLRWIAEGAPRESEPPTAPLLQHQIDEWERWLNQDSLKQQLVARYIYEHLFLAHLHFGDDSHFFRLVRSRTAPGRAVDLIASRRPFDDPGVRRVYYRIVPLQETVLLKTHMPYVLDARRMALWRRWFDEARFEVPTLPGYEAEEAANPFATFADIPVSSRYRFMLEEAQYTIMGFIKGPVCRGQQALDVIDDFFWVFFSNPDAIEESEQSRFLAANSANLRLPAELESNAPVLGHWTTYAEGQKRYLNARAAFQRLHQNQTALPGPQLIWNGRDEDGRQNPNAALTVFRHYDSASVEKGLIGQGPQSAWVISYPLLERLHYLLVAGYDVYGNIGHQLKSRLYMDFLRIEGEQNFLSLLPDPAHHAIEQRWYRGAPQSTLDYVAAAHLPLSHRATEDLAGLPPQAAYAALLGQLGQRVAPALGPQPLRLQNLPSTGLRQALTALEQVHGKSLQWLPQMVLIRLQPAQGEARWLTLLNNSAHKNVAQIFFEDLRRLPDEDTLTLVDGFVGAYPNAFWTVDETRLPELSRRIASLATEADYSALLDEFGMRRTDPRFWPLSDQAHQALRRQGLIDYGLLDYNRLENR